MIFWGKLAKKLVKAASSCSGVSCNEGRGTAFDPADMLSALLELYALARLGFFR